MDARWTAAAYANIVENELRQACASGPYILIRDNDRTGYSSKLGVRSERDCGITVIPLPKRRPDLMPMDFHFHSAVHRAMLEQETDWPEGQKETRAAFQTRLLATYASVSTGQIRSACGNMKKRVAAVINAHGGWIPRDF